MQYQIEVRMVLGPVCQRQKKSRASAGVTGARWRYHYIILLSCTLYGSVHLHFTATVVRKYINNNNNILYRHRSSFLKCGPGHPKHYEIVFYSPLAAPMYNIESRTSSTSTCPTQYEETEKKICV